MKFLTLISALLISATAYCCTCAPPFPNLKNRPNYDYYLEENDFVFHGTLVATNEVVLYRSHLHPDGFEYTEFRFLIKTVYKGNIKTDTFNVYMDHSNCRYHFIKGIEYIVYAYQPPKFSKKHKKGMWQPTTSKCQPNNTYNAKKEKEIVQYMERAKEFKNR